MNRKQYWVSVDRRTCIVMRYNRAVKLGLLQFAIFDTLHRVTMKDGKLMLSQKLCDRIYHGVKEPGTLTTLHSAVMSVNSKLRHLGLKIKGNNRGKHSFYQIVTL